MSKLPIDLASVQIRPYSDPQIIPQQVQRLHSTFLDGKLVPLAYRKEQLRNLYYGILDNRELLAAALQRDINRSPAETLLLEIGGILDEIDTAINSLDKWAKPQRTGFDFKFAAAGPKVTAEPLGTVLVIGPWNYPFLCLVVPIVSAIAAGNTVLAKPSEMVPYAGEVVSSVLEHVLDPSIFQVATGAVDETTVVLKQKFDKICFTGSTNVGRIVSRAAAEHLTPVLLELGGKSPVVITKNANLRLAAKRLVWGKLINAGQTCIAPDYVLVEDAVKEEFVNELCAAVKRSYPNLDSQSSDYSHIVTDRLWERANELVGKSNGKVALQWGKPDPATRFFPPTIVTEVTVEDALMQEELFNPILPIITIRSASEAPELIRLHDTPLAYYIFSNNKKEAAWLANEIRSGAVLVNDVVLHGGSTTIPFGGIGNSGSGAYHGKYGFDAFSHPRPMLSQPALLEPALNVRYPPYTPRKKGIIAKATVPPFVWFPRTGPVRRSIFSQILWSKWWVLFLVAAFIKYKL